MKSRRLQWAEMGERRNAYRILVVKSLGRQTKKWEDK
jgi:hypothetical protein